MKFPFLRHPIWILTSALAAPILAACTLGLTQPADRLCTLIACGPSLQIALVGEHVPTEFALSLTAAEGDYVRVLCTDGNATFDPPEAARWSPTCPAGGVALQDFTPQELSVSVSWSDGQTTQVFQPAYIESQPNGPDCEPACRAARLEVHIPAVPAYGDVSTWETYADEPHGFSIRYPAEFPPEFGPQVDGYGAVFFGDKIQVRTNSTDPLVCQGECPMLEIIEPVTIAGRPARLVRGYIGSIGGNTPQRFMLYLVRSGSTYISLMLFAESRHATTTVDPSVILPLQEADIELFNRMVQTLEWMP